MNDFTNIFDWRLYLLKWTLLAMIMTSAVHSQEQTTTFKVKYLSAENVYLEGGKVKGLSVGDTLIVRRNNQEIAIIVAAYVAEYSTSCRVEKLNAPINIGDNVYRKALRPRAVTEVPPAEEREKDTVVEAENPQNSEKIIPDRKTRKNAAKISGSIALRVFHLNDQSSSELDFFQPTARLNLRMRNLWGKEYSLRVRTRTRYNHRSRSFNNVPETEWRNRIYEASFSYDERQSPLNYRFGRILSNYLSGVGYLDGLQIQYNINPGTAVGLLAGTQPDWRNSNFQTKIQKYGAFLNFITGDYANQRHESTIAAAAQYNSGTISREFLYVRNSFSSRRGLYLYQSAEIDINRSWRKDKSGKSLVLSNLFLSGRYKFSRSFSAGISFDNRQNYWTYEVRSLADSLFDDALRTGFRANASLLLPGNYRLYVNGGIRKRETETRNTYSYAGGISQNNFLVKRLLLNINGAGFSNTFTKGYNGTARIGYRFRNGSRVELAQGVYAYRFNAGVLQRDNYWINLSGYIAVLRHLFFSGQVEHNWGDDLKGQRILAELGYRF